MSNQIPTLDKLRQEAYIQKEVQARLLHLADRAKAGTDKIKSQRGGSPHMRLRESYIGI